MVATFLDSVAVEDPEDAELLADFGRLDWSEVASVVGLAVRLRRGPWLVALGVGIALITAPGILFLMQPVRDPMVLDWPGV